MDTWWPVAAEGDIEQGKMRAFTLEGREIVVCHSREGWFALDDVCSHAYARMCEGRLRGCSRLCQSFCLVLRGEVEAGTGFLVDDFPRIPRPDCEGRL